MKHEATEKFIISQSLVNNHLPPKVSLENYLSKFKEIADIKFGFFDAAVPDYSTFFPELTVEDLKPVDEDFYYPTVRALSRVIVNKWGPIDFSERPEVLKKSIPMLLRQTVYANHEVMVGNELGSIIEAEWQDQYTQGSVKIPAGINTRLKIDAKSNPRLVRGMMMDPPSIHSFSVGVTFEWEQSHPKMDVNEFWNKLGTYDADGKLIRRVVSNIKAYHEISAVPHGADPYAQIITEKGLNNPNYAQGQESYRKSTFSFSREDFVKLGHFISYENFEEISVDGTPDNTKPPEQLNTDNKMEELEKFFTALSKVPELGIKADMTAEQAETSLVAIAAKVKQSEELSGVQVKYNALVEDLRAKVTSVYNLAKGDKADAAMLKVIAETKDETSLKAFLAQFEKDAEENFKGTCKSCGSHDVTREFSVDEEEEKEDKNQKTQLSLEETIEKMRKSSAVGVEKLHRE